MELQKHLQYITNLSVRENSNPKIRGVTANWKEDGKTACISFYFDGEVSNKDIELASDTCAEIIAHFSDGFLEEHYIRWDYPKALPNAKFLAYKRESE